MRRRRVGSAGLVLALAGLAAALPTPARAQSAGSGGDTNLIPTRPLGSDRQLPEVELRRSSSTLISRPVYRVIARARNLLAEEEYAAAFRELGALLERQRLRPVERATVLQIRGQALAEVGDYPAAARSLAEALAEDGIHRALRGQLVHDLAQLRVALGQHDEAIVLLEGWLAAGEARRPSSYYALAVAYRARGRLADATRAAQEAVARARRPRESWLQLLAALHLDAERYAEAGAPLRGLVSRHPRKGYWRQLAAVHALRAEPERALAVTQLAAEQGLLRGDADHRQLARRYLAAGIPYGAARVLEDALRDGVVRRDARALELLALCWLEAREYDRAVAPLAAAAELTGEGDLLARLAAVHVEREEWGDAARAARRAVAQGAPGLRGRALLLLGIAEAHREHFPAAERALVAARDHAASRSAAEQWLAWLAQRRAGPAPPAALAAAR